MHIERGGASSNEVIAKLVELSSSNELENVAYRYVPECFHLYEDESIRMNLLLPRVAVERTSLLPPIELSQR